MIVPLTTEYSCGSLDTTREMKLEAHYGYLQQNIAIFDDAVYENSVLK